ANLEALAKLQPAQSWEPDTAKDITAGNSSQMTDGAAAALVTTAKTAAELGLTPRARFKAFAVGAEDPVLVLSAPNPVTRKLLARSGMSIADFDAMECNEAFAAIPPMWADGRRTQPVQHAVRAGRDDLYVIHRRDAVEHVLRDGDTFSSRINDDTMGPYMGRTILAMDGDEHRTYRHLVAAAFRASN